MSQAIFLVACAVLFVVPLVFVVNDVYEDGILGRGSLLAISFASGIYLGEQVFGPGYYMPPLGVVLVSAFAVFLVWHLFRFHRRVLKQKKMAA
jgi:hypothetical protein